MTRHYASVALPAWVTVTFQAIRELFRRARRIPAAVERRREVRHLSELDDRILKDIGLSRADIDQALSEPMLRDPSILLLRSVERTGRVQVRNLERKAARPKVRMRNGASRI